MTFSKLIKIYNETAKENVALKEENLALKNENKVLKDENKVLKDEKKDSINKLYQESEKYLKLELVSCIPFLFLFEIMAIFYQELKSLTCFFFSETKKT